MPTTVRPLQVQCPTCRAAIGLQCRTLAGGLAMGDLYHAGRERSAAGFIDRKAIRRLNDRRLFRPRGQR